MDGFSFQCLDCGGFWSDYGQVGPRCEEDMNTDHKMLQIQEEHLKGVEEIKAKYPWLKTKKNFKFVVHNGNFIVELTNDHIEELVKENEKIKRILAAKKAWKTRRANVAKAAKIRLLRKND